LLETKFGHHLESLIGLGQGSSEGSFSCSFGFFLFFGLGLLSRSSFTLSTC